MAVEAGSLVELDEGAFRPLLVVGLVQHDVQGAHLASLLVADHAAVRHRLHDGVDLGVTLDLEIELLGTWKQEDN